MAYNSKNIRASLTHFIHHYGWIVLFVFIIASLSITLYLVGQAQETRSKAATSMVDCIVAENDSTVDSEEQKFLDLINQYRKEKNVAPLKNSTKMNRVAAWMAKDAAAIGNGGHVDSQGRTTYDRFKWCGVNFTGGGENVYHTSLQDTAEAAIAAWKSSPGHNANMLNTDFSTIGIGRSEKNGVWYWVTDFLADQLNDAPGGTNPTPIATASATPTPTSSQSSPQPTSIPSGNTLLTLAIKLPGIGKDGNQNPKTLTRPATVTIADIGSLQNPTSSQVNLTYNPTTGLFEGPVFGTLMSSGASNTYLVKVKLQNSLTKEVLKAYTPGTPPQVTISIFESDYDLNNDNRLTLQDYNIVRDCIKGLTTCTAANKKAADVNDDGLVDEKDLNYLQTGFISRKGD